MPVCKHCFLGLPDSVETCPDCGNAVARLEDRDDSPGLTITGLVFLDATQEFDEPDEPEEPDEPQEPEEQEEPTVLIPLVHAEPEPDIPEPQEDEPAVMESSPPPEPEVEVEVEEDRPEVGAQYEAEEDEEEEVVESDEESLVWTEDGVTHDADDAPVSVFAPFSAEWDDEPIRWAQRNYRGLVEVTSAASSGSGSVLAVFGDGLLLIPSSGGRGIGGLMRAPVRRYERILSTAGSSVDGQTRVSGSTRLAAQDISIVSIEKGRAFTRELTIRLKEGAPHRFVMPANRHGLLVKLLSPVLGEKLRDVGHAEKARGQAG